MKIKQSLIAATLGVVLGGSVHAASMTIDEAEALLERRGFSNISELDYANGYWIGRATNEMGEIVDVTVDPLEQKITTTGDGQRTTTTVTTKTTTRAVPAPATVVKEVPVIVDREVERPVIVEREVERPVVVERVVEVERPIVRQPIVVQEKVLVPLGERIDKDDVVAVLHGAGYHDVHDIDWLSNRGVWKAEARDPRGDDREIHVDPYDGSIVHVEND